MKKILYFLAFAILQTACNQSTEKEQSTAVEEAETDTPVYHAKEIKTLEIGSKAPDFKLMGVDDKEYTLSSFDGADVLAILFTCNHCPTAQAYEDRVKAYVNDYKDKGVQLVAISPNADKAIRLDELGYTDLSDSFDEMKIRAKDKNINYPYLYDGATQAIAAKYGPVATPHIFLFDSDRKLQYAGRIDDDEHIGKAKIHDLRRATDQMLAGEAVEPATTKTFGCSVKWLEKEAGAEKERESWAEEDVQLEKANLAKLKEIMANKEAENYRLVNVWATWCGPCVAEFQSLVDSDKMYRNRDFEFVTISADEEKNFDKTLKFLEKKYASNTNYILAGGINKYDMIEAVDPNWQGALPYTVLIAPDGEKVFTQMGEINILELRKAIADHIGRYYD
ncbi:redoxin domain-containing protein [Marinilongibacter aquaticus]|uniref:redoxin domain-containing protein n=1 Tax=Marinilongibacter aquaticus TaxID=2975157 RepID=UPI0021BDDFB8|nr:redoxin domain-containing protein [Marinilongibacter aquaticus]UBM58036.1 redoxin domain-containing protein [Marinilongibacter aquaticus]